MALPFLFANTYVAIVLLSCCPYLASKWSSDDMVLWPGANDATWHPRKMRKEPQVPNEYDNDAQLNSPSRAILKEETIVVSFAGL
jgi:hypothetical protein